MSLDLNLEKYWTALSSVSLQKDIGKVIEVTGPILMGYLPGASIGSMCRVHTLHEESSFLAEVVGFRDARVLLMSLGEARGVGLGSRIELLKQNAGIKLGRELLGRVIDPLGQPLDDRGDYEASIDWPLYQTGGNPMSREPIRQPLDLGVRAINAFVTLGLGQRVGIMAGSGVGKSVLMGMMARNSAADVNVIALIGERGREVREFIEDVLGPEGLKRSVLVVATSDQSPLVRMRGAFVATSISEYFCSLGANVLLMMDSVTRFAMAQREVGLSVGEPPTSKGYTPSVFSLLPKLFERAGNFEGKGSITGLYTVLVEGDDMDEPIADAVRSIVDGHIVLSRRLAQRGHFPSIDVLQSASRVQRQVITNEQVRLAAEARDLMAAYLDAEDLINIGAYQNGSNPKVDRAIRVHQNLEQFLRQDVQEPTQFHPTWDMLEQIIG